MTRPNTDHVMMNGGEIFCVHCTDTHRPPLSMPALLLADRPLGFVRMHRLCPKPAEPLPPSKQVALFDELMEQEAQRAPKCCGQRVRCVNCPIPMEVFDRFPGAISATSDEPDPETDPPGPPARHGEGPLLIPVQLRDLIAAVRPPEFWPSLKEVESWHEQVRADVQRWCRVEHAHASPIAGVKLPERFPMPNVLQNIEFARANAKKKGARPLTSKPRKSKTV